MCSWCNLYFPYVAGIFGISPYVGETFCISYYVAGLFWISPINIIHLSRVLNHIGNVWKEFGSILTKIGTK